MTSALWAWAPGRRAGPLTEEGKPRQGSGERRTSPEGRVGGSSGGAVFGSLTGETDLEVRTHSGPVPAFLSSHPVPAGGDQVPKTGEEARDGTKEACPRRDRRACSGTHP